MIDICIIGGGASGLAAAVSAAEQKLSLIHILFFPEYRKAVPYRTYPEHGNRKFDLQDL